MNLNGQSASIRRIAKQLAICDGGINIWFLPYEPAIQNVIYRQIKNSRPGDEQNENTYLSAFVILDSCVIDSELLDDDNIEAGMIDLYLNERDGSNPAGNFDLFRQLLTDSAIDALWNGYLDTRIKLPEAPKETQEDAPPEDNPLGASGSKAKKGKRGKKPTPATS